MTRALPFLLVLSTVACGGLSPQLPTAPDTPRSAVDVARTGGAALMGRSADAILPNRCDEVAIVDLSIGAETAEGWTVTAVYRTDERGNPVAACMLEPVWVAKPDLKPEPQSDGFTVFVPAPNSRPGGEETVVLTARSPNGVEGTLELGS